MCFSEQYKKGAKLKYPPALWETQYITENQIPFDLHHKLTCHLIWVKGCRVGRKKEKEMKHSKSEGGEVGDASNLKKVLS